MLHVRIIAGSFTLLTVIVWAATNSILWLLLGSTINCSTTTRCVSSSRFLHGLALHMSVQVYFRCLVNFNRLEDGPTPLMQTEPQKRTIVAPSPCSPLSQVPHAWCRRPGAWLFDATHSLIWLSDLLRVSTWSTCETLGWAHPGHGQLYEP